MVRIDEDPKKILSLLKTLAHAIEMKWVQIDEVFTESDAEVWMTCGKLTKPLTSTITIKTTSLVGEVCSDANH